MSRAFFTAVGVLSVLSAAFGKPLKVGDEAPPLKIDQWVKGEPIDVTKGDKDRIYVVEFWATWCGPCKMTIPHLSDLQDHFSKSGKVTIVGVSDEDADVVKPFVKSWDKKMRYAVAVDDDRATSEAYMKAAGVDGIPHAFIVKSGKVVWHGHPMEMDDEIVKLTGDKSWSEIAEKQQQAMENQMKLRQKYAQAAESEEWDDALAALDGILKIDASEPGAMTRKYMILATKKKDTAAASKLSGAILANVEEAMALNELAWGILTDDDFKDVRDLKLANALAEKASKITNGKDPAILDTLARARFDSGQKAEAIELQEQAVKLAKGDMKQELEKTLKRYKQGESGETDDKDDDDDDKGDDKD